MAGSNKKKKLVKQKEIPSSRYVAQVENPDSYYKKNPAWNFNTCDTTSWAFAEENIGNNIWSEIIPFLKNMEKMTWAQILLDAKKQHHSISVYELNSSAQKRLAELYIEKDSLISLRLNGTHRIYGYIIYNVFNILWYDPNHGDNDTCVCRSTKKNT